MVPDESGFFIYLREIARDVLELLPIAAFILMSTIPTQALAFVEQIEITHQPLLFELDSDLEKTIMNVGGPARSRSAQIPNAPKIIVAGMSLRILLTAYSSTVGETDSNPFKTAAGTQVNRHTLAANFLPLGTRVRIGDQEFTVLDHLNSRYDNKLIGDKWVETREEAIQFGVRVVEMEIDSLP